MLVKRTSVAMINALVVMEIAESVGKDIRTFSEYADRARPELRTNHPGINFAAKMSPSAIAEAAGVTPVEVLKRQDAIRKWLSQDGYIISKEPVKDDILLIGLHLIEHTPDTSLFKSVKTPRAFSVYRGLSDSSRFELSKYENERKKTKHEAHPIQKAMYGADMWNLVRITYMVK